MKKDGMEIPVLHGGKLSDAINTNGFMGKGGTKGI